MDENYTLILRGVFGVDSPQPTTELKNGDYDDDDPGWGSPDANGHVWKELRQFSNEDGYVEIYIKASADEQIPIITGYFETLNRVSGLLAETSTYTRFVHREKPVRPWHIIRTVCVRRTFSERYGELYEEEDDDPDDGYESDDDDTDGKYITETVEGKPWNTPAAHFGSNVIAMSQYLHEKYAGRQFMVIYPMVLGKPPNAIIEPLGAILMYPMKNRIPYTVPIYKLLLGSQYLCEEIVDYYTAFLTPDTEYTSTCTVRIRKFGPISITIKGSHELAASVSSKLREKHVGNLFDNRQVTLTGQSVVFGAINDDDNNRYRVTPAGFFHELCKSKYCLHNYELIIHTTNGGGDDTECAIVPFSGRNAVKVLSEIFSMPMTLGQSAQAAATVCAEEQDCFDECDL